MDTPKTSNKMRSCWLDQDVRPTVYLHIQQAYSPQAMSLVVRTRGRPANVVQDLREALRRLDPALPLHSVATM